MQHSWRHALQPPDRFGQPRLNDPSARASAASQDFPDVSPACRHCPSGRRKRRRRSRRHPRRDVPSPPSRRSGDRSRTRGSSSDPDRPTNGRLVPIRLVGLFHFMAYFEFAQGVSPRLIHRHFQIHCASSHRPLSFHKFYHTIAPRIRPRRLTPCELFHFQPYRDRPCRHGPSTSTCRQLHAVHN